jgi:chorismate-pyruvate lyase
MNSDPQRPSESAATSAISATLGHPLDEFYAATGLPLPPLQAVEAEEVPQPYKQLLVHNDDMTPTLERFHGCDLHLRILGRRRRGNEYFREVVLLADGTEEPVEFGAIKINLNRLNEATQQHILEERRPLGHILLEDGIPHSSRPKAFLRVASDRFINEALRLSGANVLYGRRNTLYDPDGCPLAEIVEILPPSKGGR